MGWRACGLLHSASNRPAAERTQYVVPQVHVPHGSAGGRLDEAGHVQPLEAMMTNRDRSIAHRRPHATRYRLQADPMLVRRPDFDRCARMLPLFVGRGLLKFF
jgi:hypothetical protein